MVKWVTTETIAGYEVTKHIDVVTGSTIRARNIGRDIMAMFRMLVGGELPEYTEMMAHSREQALQRMLERAEHLDADAVVNVRFNTAMVMQATAEIMVYGTAVKLKKCSVQTRDTDLEVVFFYGSHKIPRQDAIAYLLG